MKSSRPFSSRPGPSSFAKGPSSSKDTPRDKKRPVTAPKRGSGAPDRREDRGGARPPERAARAPERSARTPDRSSRPDKPGFKKEGTRPFSKSGPRTTDGDKDSSRKPFAARKSSEAGKSSDARKPFAARKSAEPVAPPAREPKKEIKAERTPHPRAPSSPTKGREKAIPKVFLIWGRRPVDSFLGKLSEGKFGEALESTSTEKILKSSVLYLMGDSAGKVPSQLKDSVDLATTLGIKTRVCKGHEDEMWPLPSDDGLQHQRVVLSVPSYPTESLYEILLPKTQSTKGCVGIVLDQVQDPRNFGAILRSAAFFGCTFAVFGEDRQAPLSSTVLKASSGGAFSLQLCSVVNIGRALNYFKEKGFWIVGSSLSDTSVDHTAIPIDRPYVLVLGNEGKGLRQEIANKCDYLAKIPGGSATLDSLNVGVACGILLERLHQTKE